MVDWPDRLRKLEVEIIAAKWRWRQARAAHDLACERAFIDLNPKTAAKRTATLRALNAAELTLDVVLQKRDGE